MIRWSMRYDDTKYGIFFQYLITNVLSMRLNHAPLAEVDNCTNDAVFLEDFAVGLFAN